MRRRSSHKKSSETSFFRSIFSRLVKKKENTPDIFIKDIIHHNEEEKNKKKITIKVGKKTLVKIAIILVCSCLITAIYIFLQWYFSIKTIQLTQSKKNVPIVGIYAWNSQNLLFVSEQNIKEDLITNNPQVKDVIVYKQFPDTLEISIIFYDPIASFIVNDGFFELSSDGRILEKTREKISSLPLVQYYQKLNYSSYQTGDKLAYKDILMSLYFLQKALDLGLKINSIDINGFSMIGLYGEDKKLLFTTEKDQGLQEYQLEKIMRQFKIDGRDFSVLDLRFDKPIVEFKNSKM